MTTKTRAEMEADYGSLPPATTTWTIHRAHASVTWTTDDGGDTWTRKTLVHAADRARRDAQAVEQADIQRNLK